MSAKLGEILVRENLISSQQLREALEYQRGSGGRLGSNLVKLGIISDNTPQKQEGLNYMQRFAEVAPDNHPLKSSVKDAVEYLKTQDKLAPEKIKPSPKKKP